MGRRDFARSVARKVRLAQGAANEQALSGLRGIEHTLHDEIGGRRDQLHGAIYG
jgi:hypothetical protein